MKKFYVFTLLIISAFFCFCMPTHVEAKYVDSAGNVNDKECDFIVNSKDVKDCHIYLYRYWNSYGGNPNNAAWNWRTNCTGYDFTTADTKDAIKLKVVGNAKSNPKDESKWCPSSFHYKVNKDKKTIKISLTKMKNETGTGKVVLKECTEEEAKQQAEDTADKIQKPTDKETILTGVKVGKEYKACDQILSDGVVSILKEIFIIIEIATPIILIIMSMIDFTKAIVSSDSSAVNKALSRFVRRLLIAAAIFLAPTLIEFIIDVTGISDGVCGIG